MVEQQHSGKPNAPTIPATMLTVAIGFVGACGAVGVVPKSVPGWFGNDILYLHCTLCFARQLTVKVGANQNCPKCSEENTNEAQDNAEERNE